MTFLRLATAFVIAWLVYRQLVDPAFPGFNLNDVLHNPSAVIWSILTFVLVCFTLIGGDTHNNDISRTHRHEW